jgi:HEPN domain-containing protein
LTAEEEKVKAQDYFDTWFPQASGFIKTGKFSSEDSNQKIAAFLLHQAAESLYYATLLVYTGYKPKTHNLYKLRRKAKHLSEELFLLFPIETDKIEKHLFEQLKKGYIDARYRKDFFITKEEVEALIIRVTKMNEIVERICKEKIHHSENK